MSHRIINLGVLAGLSGSCALGCAHEVESPALTLTGVGPDLLCNSQRLEPQATLLLSGRGFAPMPSNVLTEPAVLELPSVELTRRADLSGAAANDPALPFSGDPSGERASELGWQSADQLSLRVSEPDAAGGSAGLTLAAGLYDVQVTNPDGKTRQALPRALAVVEPPRIARLAVSDSSVETPKAVCTDQQSRSVTLSGSDFLTIDAAPPAVSLSGQAATNVAFGGCNDVPGTYAGGQLSLCDSLTLTLGPGEFAPATYDVAVTSAEPAACRSSEPEQLVIVAAPLVTRVAPAAICIDQSAQQLNVEGGSFARVGTTTPTVTVLDSGGGEAVFSPDTLTGCANPAGTDASFGLQLCTGFTLTLPSARFAPGTYALRVTNPDPVGCSSSTDVEFTINPPPRVDGVSPGTVCSGGSVLVASGAGLLEGASAELVCSGGTKTLAALTTSALAGSALSMTFGPGVDPGESCDLIVQNADGCQDRPLPHQVVVGTEGPVLFNADPNVAYNDINTRVNLFVTALDPPFTVSMWPSGSSGAQPIELVAALAPGKTTQLQATIPSGTAPGEYDIAVNDQSGCSAIMERAVVVTDDLSIDGGLVSPSFTRDAASQALTIVLDSASGASGTPRAFLNPAGDEAAVQLASVTRINDTTLTAIAPAGTPAGSYDVVLVWPDGAVAVLSDAFTSVTSELPEISDVVPQSIVNQSGAAIELRGTGFDTSEVSLRCSTAGGEVTIEGASAPEDCTSGCSQAATFDASPLAPGDVCVARVTNADGVYSEFSAIGITNSSYNLAAPRAGEPLNVARRALASAAIQATSAARFVYAIGGDTGSAATALDSVEFAPIDLFGNMSPWVISRQSLPAARSFAADATIGRYLYVFGGSGETGAALASGARALVLSPEEVPSVTNVDLCLAGGNSNCFGAGAASGGLAAGDYSYRVAALIDAGDPVNLGGETLASDPLILRLRGTDDRSIWVKIEWSAPNDALGAPLSGVVGYRIYRTAQNGVPGSDEQLLAEVDATTLELVDDGSVALTADETPLPQGSTSSWQALPDLNAAREGARGVVAQDPADPDTWYVYALLGRDGATGLDTYEYLPVTLAANGRQTLASAWTAGDEQAAVGRWQHGAWAIDSVDSQFVSGSDTYIYIGGGLLADGTTRDDRVEAGLVTAGGQLTAFADDPTAGDDVRDFSSTRVGYGTAGAADTLFVFGGLSAQVNQNATAGRFVDPAPGLGNNSWNNEGLSLTTPRYLMGSSIQSAFIFIVGGQTGAATTSVTNTSETVVW